MPYAPIPCERVIHVSALFTLYDFRFATGYVFRGESHPFWEMVYVGDGAVDIGADERKIMLTQGDVIFHKPGEFHSIWANYAHAPSIVVITFACDSPGMRFFENRTMRVLPQHRAIVQAILREARETFGGALDTSKKIVNEAHVGGVQMLILLLEALLIALLRYRDAGEQAEEAVERHEEWKALDEAVKYMRAHLQGEVRFADVCRHTGMGATALKQLFRRQTGVSPMAYYEQLRMGEARRLLSDVGLNVAQTAETLGFSSPSYFSSRFHRVTGMSPTAYLRATVEMDEEMVPQD
ncbi:MAG: helix-turn-helix transcriptional regulator [Clostridiales bacterium]|nr:helix-turn-helix transcriptional regulator [Clostridiales bacterium]